MVQVLTMGRVPASKSMLVVDFQTFPHAFDLLRVYLNLLEMPARTAHYQKGK
jgi:hypothetical protein